MELIKEMSTEQMIAVFIRMGQINNPYAPTVRGWIMDELEARDPKAFDKWLNDEVTADEDLYKYYN